MKILAAIPMQYADDDGFWRRDLGLVVRALRILGHEAYFVAIGTENQPSDKPLKLISRSTMTDPTWWQRERADGIILNTWAATRHDDIRSAALTADCAVIEKLDTDGVKTPRMFLSSYVRCELVDYDLRYPIRQGLVAWAEGLLRTLVVYSLPSILDRRIIRCIERVPLLAAETPVAASRIHRFLRMYRAQPMPNVATVPHPVDLTHIGFNHQDAKENHVIVVGRWDAAIKGWPLLKRLAVKFLTVRPDWKMFVVGSGAREEGSILAQRFNGRFQMLGHLDHRQLGRHLRAAKIYLLTSHYESFNIAGAEALCSGCSVVGPAQIPSASYFASKSSGTAAHVRNVEGMNDALIAEVMEWESERRDPQTISHSWQQEMSAESVAKKYLGLFARLSPS